MTVRLPSGRKLYYAEPRLEPGLWGRPRLTFSEPCQKTGRWRRSETYYGRLTENIVQAVARDCLADAIYRLWWMGFDIRFHVHDEIVIEGAPRDLGAAIAVMRAPPPWAPGLPLGAEGFHGPYYRKD
jgi:DNA polymerase